MDIGTQIASLFGAQHYPGRTVCRACGIPFRFLVLDLQYCSYACAGVTVPDASTHPASCWTWDGKPKMGFPTLEAAERTCTGMHVPGTRAYYCPLHHYWHVGYSDGSDQEEKTG
jgi:hypothetical protein